MRASRQDMMVKGAKRWQAPALRCSAASRILHYDDLIVLEVRDGS